MSSAAPEQAVSGCFTRTYAAVAVVALVGLLTYTSLALLLVHGQAIERANTDFGILNGLLTAVYIEQRTLSSAGFLEAAALALAKPNGPEAILMSSNVDGVLYASADRADRILALQGAPTEIATRPLARVLSAPFRGAREMQLHASYPLLRAADAFPILRTALFGVLVFVLLSGIALALRIILRPHPASRHASAWPAKSRTRQLAMRDAPIRQSGNRSRQRPRQEASAPIPGSMISAAGISRSDFLHERLDSELTRAGGLDAELCLVLVAGRGLGGDRQRYVRLGAILREVAIVPDLAFEYGETGFALIMPETDLSNAIDKLGSVRSLYDRDGQGVTIAIGISERHGRLIDGKRIFAEAKRALEKAVRAGGNQLVGFRSDPVKFRRRQGPSAG